MRTYDSFGEAWMAELGSIRGSGEEVSPRGQYTLEKRWAQFAVSNPLTFPLDVLGREFRDVIGVLEALSLVGQFSIPEMFTDRVKKFAEFTDAGVFHGSYGARVAGRLGDLVSLLERDPDTRQAVLSIYDSRSDLGAAKKDIPCTLSLHFLRRAGSPGERSSLEMRATMRSNDIWLGTPYDFIQFAILQASIAQAVGAVPSTYVHSAGSLHLYDRDFLPASKVYSFKNPAASMGYPLWGCGDDIGEISSRARRLAMDPRGFSAVGRTEFETWAQMLLLETR